jgi:ABC-type transport system involved in cytochrome c biogenesis permease subunit
LTIGIISGGVWANGVGFILELGSKTWALITWLVFATYLHADHKGWEGKSNIFGGLGFFVIWICYLE